MGEHDKHRGLYNKFIVQRTDGSSGPGGKHENCRYFVLDLTHDKHAPAALEAYAYSCRNEYPALAADLMQVVALHKQPADAPKHCSVCGLPQMETISGLVCSNGHGGAPSKEG